MEHLGPQAWMGKRVSLDHLEQPGRVDYQDLREMLEKMVPKVIQEKRVTLDHLLQELRENLENLAARGRRENQASLVLKENQGYQGYQEQKVIVGRRGLLEEVNEEILEPRGQRVIVETKETLALWDHGVHLDKRGIQEPQRS